MHDVSFLVIINNGNTSSDSHQCTLFCTSTCLPSSRPPMRVVLVGACMGVWYGSPTIPYKSSHHQHCQLFPIFNTIINTRSIGYFTCRTYEKYKHLPLSSCHAFLRELIFFCCPHIKCGYTNRENILSIEFFHISSHG